MASTKKSSKPKILSSKTNTGSQESDRVDFVIKRFNDSWTYASNNYHQCWLNSWRLYNNRRVNIGYSGVSNVFVPMTFSTIQTMESALANGKPSFNFLPPQQKPDQNTDILNSLLDYFWDKDQWNIKVQSWIRSMLIYGTGIVYLYWDVDHPVMINIPLRDFFVDPNAVSLENNGGGFYCGRRFLTTKEDLASYEIVDPATGEMTKKYKNLEKLSAVGGANTETDKAVKEMFYGSTAPKPEQTQVEAIELWTEDRVVAVANRSTLIQDEENPFKTQAKLNGNATASGIIPFAVQRDYIDESLFYGKGEIEVITDLQEWLNDLTNQNNDAISYVLNPMWNVNPAKADIIEKIQAAPGRAFALNASDLSPIQMPNIPPQAFEERLNIKNEIREATAADQVVKGVTTTQQTTATEINAQMAQAGQRIGIKITQLENEGFHRLARIVFDMTRLYVRAPTPIQIASAQQPWQLYDPEEFMEGTYEPRVQLEANAEGKRKEDQQLAQNMYLALSQDPNIDQIELKKLVLPRMFSLDPDEVDRLIKPMAPMGSDLGLSMQGGLSPMPSQEAVPPSPSQMPEQPAMPNSGAMLPGEML